MFKKIMPLALLFASMGLTSCQHRPNFQQPTKNYAAIVVRPSNQTVVSSYPATIEGTQDIAIYPQVSGTITRIEKSEGTKVKKGETLFVIDQVPFRAAVNTAKAQVEAGKAGLATAKLTLESKERLHKEAIISSHELQTAQNNYATAQANLAQAKAQLVNAENNLSYTVVKSPCDGVMGTLPYREGALVSPSLPQPLTIVSNNAEMFVYFSLSEKGLLALVDEYGSVDQIIEHLADVTLELNNGTTYAHNGKIETISRVISKTTGAIQVKARFANPEGILMTGGIGTIHVPNVLNNVITISQKQAFQIQDKYFVYYNANGVAKTHIITVQDLKDGKNFMVTSGLSAGDTIIAEGVGFLREGTPVTTTVQQ